jgi:hypothetical protein
VDREFDKRPDNDEEWRRPKEILLGIVPVLGLMAATLNFFFALLATCPAHWAAVWTFGLFCGANVAIMFLPMWWRKVNSRKAPSILLVVVFAGWVTNGFVALRWMLALLTR